jgi:predicted glycosyltransferase
VVNFVLDHRPRIAIFTHDTYGLGHLRRCLHIVGALARRAPETAILLITGSRAVYMFDALPPNADFLKIPSLVTTGTPESRPPNLPIGTKQVTSIRKRLIRSALDSFKPDLLLVDNFPLGARKELVPTLKLLRELDVPAVLGLRDIVDDSEVIRRRWMKERIYEVLEHDYHRILVYGVPEVFDVARAYDLPRAVAEKIRYCGYVTAGSSNLLEPANVRAELQLESPFAVATVGGGGDGLPLRSTFVRAVKSLENLSAVVVTGPLMSAVDRGKIVALVGDDPCIIVKEFIADLRSLLAAADVVVAMGGYNTTAELLALRRRALVMPRNWKFGEHERGTEAGVEWEQLLRARALQRAGIAEVLDPDGLDSQALAKHLVDALACGPRFSGSMFDVDGVRRVADNLLELAQTRSRHAKV